MIPQQPEEPMLFWHVRSLSIIPFPIYLKVDPNKKVEKIRRNLKNNEQREIHLEKRRRGSIIHLFELETLLTQYDIKIN